MIRDLDVHQLSCSELNDYEHIEALKRRRDHGQEITGNDRLGVISHEDRPALIASWWSPRAFRHALLANGTRRDLDAELEQEFIGDALLAPARIVARHCSDEHPQFRWYPLLP